MSNRQMFSKGIRVIKSETKWGGKTDTGQFIVTEAKLE